jgi:hypothetical protein
MKKESKKLNLKTSAQVNGKVENDFRPTTLDELWGGAGSKYTQSSLAEYEEELNQMNSADIRAHAVKIGFMPHSDVNRLKKKLVAEYEKFAATFKERPIIKNNLKMPSKEVIKIMSEVK